MSTCFRVVIPIVLALLSAVCSVFSCLGTTFNRPLDGAIAELSRQWWGGVVKSIAQDFYVVEMIGGWGGIRTHGTLSRTLVFKTSAFNHSATHPCQAFGARVYEGMSPVF